MFIFCKLYDSQKGNRVSLYKYSKNKSNDNINKKNRQAIYDKEQEWLKENKEAIEKQNERIKKEGSFSDEHRRF